MSMLKIPLTALEKDGLLNHHLPVDTPSQLADAFRHGMAWAQTAESRTKPVCFGIDDCSTQALSMCECNYRCSEESNRLCELMKEKK